MWSVIIRFSIDGDNGSKVRNKLATVLGGAGFAQFGGNTGSWRNESINQNDACKKMAEVLMILSDPSSNVTNVDASTLMDHIWIYIEQIHLQSESANVDQNYRLP